MGVEIHQDIEVVERHGGTMKHSLLSGADSNRLRRLLVCIGFASLCLLPMWMRIATPLAAYYRRTEFTEAFLALAACEALLVLILGSVWKVLRGRRLHHRPIVHAACLAFLVCPAVAAYRVVIPALGIHLSLKEKLVGAALAGIVFVLLLRSVKTSSWLMRHALLLVLPGVGLLMFRAANIALYVKSDFADGAPAPRLATVLPTRVVWIIFDEMDQRVAFSGRPPTISLPNLDRFGNEAFSGEHVLEPGPSTTVSLPALTTGLKLEDAREAGPREMSLVLPDGHTRPWSSTDTIFDDAQRAGGNTAVVGWYHPYGRVLAHSLTTWTWEPVWYTRSQSKPVENEFFPAAVGQVAVGALTKILGDAPGRLGYRQSREAHIHVTETLRGAGLRVAADPSIGLSLLHMPVPHVPRIWNRRAGRYTSTGPSSYLDNLVLADIIFGEIRGAMEKAGLWESTAVLVSSDHAWRPRLWRADHWTVEEETFAGSDEHEVPFLLKLPGQRQPVAYTRPFNARITRALLREVFMGQLKQPQAVAAWISEAAKHAPNGAE